MSFVAAQRLAQGDFLARSAPGRNGHEGAAYRLAPEDVALNLAPAIQSQAQAYFRQYGITWHRHASHGLSSQVCCLNFLMPLARRPDVLADIVAAALDIPPPQMLPVEKGPDSQDWWVGFEWIGGDDYLGEWPKAGRATRGANATSADAIVRFEHGGVTETLLIEWKYTETYGAPIPGGGNNTRLGRYQSRAFAPDGPLKPGVRLEDFFWEPFYQLVRQQMLAWQMQKAREDGAARVRVLHISPAGNRDLHKVTSPAFRALGDDAFQVFASLLVEPGDFISRTTEQAFGPALAEHRDDPWAAYLADRYSSGTQTLMAATFKTNPVSLDQLLRDCEAGVIQLPDFQRSWVWDEERIKGLLASISQAFPVGALMTLETGGEGNFAPRLIQGAPEQNAAVKPTSLLLDGQQRMTSLYQTARRQAVVKTVTARKKEVSRWYYVDIRKALDPETSREEAIVGVPEDRIIRSNFGKDIELDLTTPEKEYAALMFPVNRVFDWYDWGLGFRDHWDSDKAVADLFKLFREGVLANFGNYQVPVIALDRTTSKEAVCLVFEKVNTGGKALDAFELVTAIYAADGFRLRDDWAAREKRLKQHKVLADISSTEFMQAISLLHTKTIRRQAEAAGREGRELPAVSATRQSLLKLPLEAYRAHADAVEAGLDRAARFLRLMNIYRSADLPYQSQITPLAAILVELGERWENDEVRRRLARWYWNGVFGELYGSATESRLARDMLEVPAWIDGQDEPSTISTATFDAKRLNSMRTRLSAAYKGVSALLMKSGANDFRSGQDFDQTIAFGETVDIHHIFPKAWCENAGFKPDVYDSIINKTPLGSRTNRILGGVAPSAYIARLEQGWEQNLPIDADRLNDHLASHLIEPLRLRADDFTGFLAARREALLALIETATGKTVYRGEGEDEEGEYNDEVEVAAAELVAA